MRYRISLLLGSATTLLAAAVGHAQATPGPVTAPSEAGAGDIVVTAQKRSQKLNDVPMSVAAASADTLRAKGVIDTADLGKIVSGFRSATSNTLTPVYVLRGVGLYDSGLASAPTVSVYSDEIPFAFPIMTRVATLDLERVEVLKGPQGTLFGQNSTGGAINYIAAKPTRDFAAGLDLSYTRFGKLDGTGFVSGPLSDTLEARLAVRAVEGGAWQRSQTRPGDKLGGARDLQARLLLNWHPSDRLKFTLSLSGDRDNSDTQAPQLDRVAPVVPSNAVPGLIGSPIARHDNRTADWSPEYPNRVRDRYYQAALRGEYKLTDDITFISISNYAHMTTNRNYDQDGAAVHVVQNTDYGKIDAFDQEVRLAGSTSNLTWIVGANYDYAKVDDFYLYDQLNSTRQPVPTLPGFNLTLASTTQHINTYAGYGNVEYHLSDHLVAHGGVRYTRSIREGVSCTSDPGADQSLTNQFNAIQAGFAGTPFKNTPYQPSAPYSCLSFVPAPVFLPAGPVHTKVDEDNVSWRVGLDYKLDGGTLLYANYSRGWKAGVIAPVVALNTSSYAPVKQERLDAYEVGFKAPLFDRKLQLNAAAFYYDYKDKQLRTRFLDTLFGLLERLENVPKSRVIGVEAELVARPVRGLDLSISGTYLDAKVNGAYSTYNANGIPANYDGSRLPYTPRLSIVSDAQYQWALSQRLKAMVGASVTYNSQTQATFGTAVAPANGYVMPRYALLDLRAGIGAPDDSWRVQIFGRNVTNKYYLNNITDGIDTRYRYAGLPATYGVTLSLRTR